MILAKGVKVAFNDCGRVKLRNFLFLQPDEQKIRRELTVFSKNILLSLIILQNLVLRIENTGFLANVVQQLH